MIDWIKRLLGLGPRTRGRTKPDSSVKARPRGRISARVYRTETGWWEDLGEVAGPERVKASGDPRGRDVEVGQGTGRLTETEFKPDMTKEK